MAQLYFGICPFGSTVDVFINLLAGWNDNWLQPCAPDINANGYPIHRVHEDYVLKLSKNDPLTFRDIDYTNRMDEIEEVLNNNIDKKVWIGTFNPEQAALVKEHFKDRATTVAVTYDETIYPLVLRNVVGYLDLCEINDPQEREAAFQEKYKARQERWDYLVPKQFKPTADVVFNLGDLYDFNIATKFIEDLDGKRTDAQLSYYTDWLEKNKETYNENI